MADKTGYIGRNPNESNSAIVRQTYSLTSNTTELSFTAGYLIGFVDVYVNGVRLIDVQDYAANDTSTITLTTAAVSGDVVEIVAYKALNVGNVENANGNFTVGSNLSVGSTATLSGVTTCEGDLYVGGDLYVLDDIVYDEVTGRNLNITGIATAATIHVGSATTIDGSGVNVTGVITATSFSGDGSSLTGVAATDYIVSNTLKVVGISTFSGEVTAAGGVDVTGGLKVGAASTLAAVSSSGVVNLTNTTDSTSSTTGALIISGGVGIAKSLFVGNNVTIGGTLTYEDVTNIDSVGLITARTGVRVTAGGLVVTAGITTVGAGLSLADNIKARFGTSGDLEIYHSGSESHIREQGTGGLILNSSVTTIKNAGDSETIARFTENGGVDLNFDNSTKLATTNTGVVVTGVATASDYYIGVGGTSVHTALGTKASTGKAIAMAMVFG